ncbi:unannotated protein [freshwater metagenome]|uniref:Unannotated protein n=1 Tax=freshwater metagenome TaxID=449393 RepID=A0A6J7FN89_9ZZZZ
MGAIGAPWHVMDVSNNFPGHRREVVVLGSTASATLPGSESDHVEVHDHSGTERIAFTAEQPLLAELRCFLGYLTGGPAPITNAREGAITVRRIAEIRQHILDRQSPASMEQRN